VRAAERQMHGSSSLEILLLVLLSVCGIRVCVSAHAHKCLITYINVYKIYYNEMNESHSLTRTNSLSHEACVNSVCHWNLNVLQFVYLLSVTYQ